MGVFRAEAIWSSQMMARGFRNLIKAGWFWTAVIILFLCATVVTQARAAVPEASSRDHTFRPSPDMSLDQVIQLVRERFPDVQSLERDVDVAAAEVRQSYLWENPNVDGSWATIPVGETNPAGLEKPFANIPNYGVGLSYRFLIGKRSPRQQRAEALERAVRASRSHITRLVGISVVRSVGSLAVAMLRVEAAGELFEDAKRSLDLAASRLAAKFGTPLDVDRLQIELNRVRQHVVKAEGEISASLADCASILGMTCERFGSSAQARAFVTRWVDQIARAQGVPFNRRGDVRALFELEKAASAELDLAKAQAIPDPTVRVGFTHDRFTISGNQQNSLSLQLSVPLPVFDAGQAQQQAALARRNRFAQQRRLLSDTVESRVQAIRKTLDLQRRRQVLIGTEMVPLAQAVLQDVERAASNRLVGLSDVIQARRALHELVGEEADSLAMAFDASMDLVSELPDRESTSLDTGSQVHREEQR